MLAQQIVLQLIHLNSNIEIHKLYKCPEILDDITEFKF